MLWTLSLHDWLEPKFRKIAHDHYFPFKEFEITEELREMWDRGDYMKIEIWYCEKNGIPYWNED